MLVGVAGGAHSVVGQVVVGDVRAVTAARLRAGGTVGLGHARLPPSVRAPHHAERIV